MSLIGSLEDLSLGDILQIISLSQKSGVLSIRGEDGEGSIVLRDGLVRSATLKGGPVDLRGVLVDGRFLEPEEFDHASECARRDGTTVEEAISVQTSMSMERIDSLRRECVEAAVMAMFAWQTGEFSFDVRADVRGEELPLCLPTGINAQYLAMEGSRIEDESTHIRQEWQEESGAGPVADLPRDPQVFASQEPDSDEITLVDAEPVLTAVEAIGLATAERADPQDGEGALEVAEEIPNAVAVPESIPAATPALPNAPLVVIDPDLVALEWMKKTLKDSFPRIHIFQRWDLGLNPIRQYLARATRPVVLLHVDASGDPLSGIRSGHDFVARLKSQQPRLPVLWLQDSEKPRVDDLGAANASLTRPGTQQLRSPRAAEQLGRLAEELRHELATVLASELVVSEPAQGVGAPEGDTQSLDELRRLKEATEVLAEASTRGEALPLAIRFASEIFDRVAMFMVRGDTLVGMAQHGLSSAGGPDDEGLRRVELNREGAAWFRSVLEHRHSLRAAPTDGGDYTLAALLGSAAAQEAYIAPIESGGEVVALVYADNLVSERPLGDSRALEVVLHHVGLALERSMLERALAEAQNPDPNGADG